MRAKKLALAAVAALAAVSLGAVAPTGANGASCTPASNIEAIIDDSGSMAGTDFDKLRVAGMKLLIAKSDMKKKTLGAIEFGDTVGTLFAPQLIAGNESAMGAALDANVDSNNGSTDYNLAFQQANADNPTANARIFLTDGGHNGDTYANGHLPGPPTYVIGLGTGIPDEDKARLQQIANDTGGNYQQVDSNADVQAAINKIDSYLNCQTAPLQFSDTFTKLNQTKSHSSRISSRVKSADLVLTWSSPLDTFTLSSIKLKTSSGTIASISKRRHLRVTRTKGATFLSVRVRGLKRGKLIFKLKMTKNGSGSATGVNLTTQLSRSKRR